MLSKKEKRWESKKRKIQAFLDVAKLNEYEKEAQLPKRPRIEQNKESLTCEDKVFKSRDRQTITERTLGCEIVSDDRNDVEHNDSSKTQEELVALRKQLKARQKANMEKPKVFLTPEQLFMEKYSTATPIIFTLDIQHLLLYAIQGNISSYKPRWCRLLRWSKVSQVMVIVVEDSCAKDLIQFADSAPYLCARFEMKIELAAPQQYGSSIEKELFRVPLSKRKIKDKEAKAEECENYDDAKKYGKMYRNVIPLEPVIADHPESMGVEGVISPVDIMLSPEQMIQEGYPLPIQGQYQHYKFTKDVYSKVKRYSPVFGLDCEMCLTTSGKNELTRVSVVNTKSETIYDSLVKPYNTITNYLTRYSGITKEILQDVTTRLEDVQHVLQEIIPPDAIIVGQSLNGDLHALQMLHPYVIDTSVIYNLSGDRTRKTGLRRLAAEFLDRQIQNDPAGHNPCEDARAAMDLVLLKLKKGLLFGDVVLGGYQPHLGGWFEADKEDTSQQQIPDDGEESEEIQSKIHIAENSMSENRINTAALIEKRKLFFERPGNSYENFFDLVKDSKKSVMVVGTESNLAGIDGNVKKVEVSSDKEAVKVISNTETEHFLNCLYLKKFESCDCSDEENIKMSLGKVDKRIRKLMKRLRENTLCMVIFTGRITDNFYVENGYCLVNVT